MLTYLTFHGKNSTNQNQKAKTKEKSKKILDLWRLDMKLSHSGRPPSDIALRGRINNYNDVYMVLIMFEKVSTLLERNTETRIYNIINSSYI